MKKVTIDGEDEAEKRDKRVSSEVLPSVYEDLRRLAAGKMSNEAPGQTLSATALVHEAYLRISSGEEEDGRWDSRGHFYVAAAETMRRILIDRARRKKAVRHGGEYERTPLDSVVAPAPARSDELLALDEALTTLAGKDPRKAKLVELRYFVGLTSGEAAEVLGISKATADRDWAYTRAWLLHEMGRAGR